MVELNDETIEKIVESLHTKLKASSHSDFYIDPEEHYNAHINLSTMYKDWKGVRRAIDRVFLGFLTVGTVTAIGLGILAEFFKTFSDWLKGH